MPEQHLAKVPEQYLAKVPEHHLAKAATTTQPSLQLSSLQPSSGERGNGMFTARMPRLLNVKWERHFWPVLDPRTSVFVKRWDLVNALALLVTATITPYEVGFLQKIGRASCRERV